VTDPADSSQRFTKKREKTGFEWRPACPPGHHSVYRFRIARHYEVTILHLPWMGTAAFHPGGRLPRDHVTVLEARAPA